MGRFMCGLSFHGKKDKKSRKYTCKGYGLPLLLDRGRKVRITKGAKMKKMISDSELQLIFSGKRMNARFDYEVIFQNESQSAQLSFKRIWANNKVEAVHIAREYGVRFIDARVVEVRKVAY